MPAAVQPSSTKDQAASVLRLEGPKAGLSSPQAIAAVWQPLLTFTAVFIASCVLLFAELGSFPLFNPDEALYSEPAREMLLSGDWMTTHLNYVVRYTKPPLVIWAQALSFQLFGVNEFAARFFGAACGALLIAATYVFCERYLSRKVALVSSLVLVLSPLYLGTAREAITDMPLSLMMGVAVMAFFHAFEQRAFKFCWLGYLMMGLAVMIKGPVGLILPVAIVGTYHLLCWNVLAALKFYKPWLGMLLVAVIAVPWFAAEIILTKGAYYYEFLVRENFQRFTSVVDHPAPWWYHLAAVAGGMMPWTIFLIPSFGIIRPSRVNTKQRALLLCACWSIVTIVFFSVGVSKLLTYTVPAFPALAVLIGVYVCDCIEQKRSRLLGIPLLILAVATGIAALVVPPLVLKLKEAPVELIGLTRTGLFCIFGTALVAAFLSLRGKLAAALSVFLVCFYLCVACFGVKALEMVSAVWEGPLTKYARFAGSSNLPVFVYHMRKPSIPFYSNRQVIIPEKDELVDALKQTNGAYIISKKKSLDFLLAQPRCRLLAAEGLYVLVVQQRIDGAPPSHYKPIIRPM